MATKKKTTSVNKDKKGQTKVTRIDAKDNASNKVSNNIKANAKTAKTKANNLKKDDQQNKSNAFVAFLGYFRGSWYELTQVRWPDRKATWGLTLAVIIFTAFFVGLIILLDYVFQLGFDQVIG